MRNVKRKRAKTRADQERKKKTGIQTKMKEKL